jgi:hypothetical protein
VFHFFGEVLHTRGKPRVTIGNKPIPMATTILQVAKVVGLTRAWVWMTRWVAGTAPPGHIESEHDAEAEKRQSTNGSWKTQA